MGPAQPREELSMSYAELSILAGGDLALLVAYLAVRSLLLKIKAVHYLFLFVLTVILVTSLKLQLDVASGSGLVTTGRGLALSMITLEIAAAALIIGRSIVLEIKGILLAEVRSQTNLRQHK
jgi:hypothetical protein